jgi:hypothetical protein
MRKKYIRYRYRMALRILAKENVPGAAIDALRRLGHDMVWTRIHATGSPDEAVPAQAQTEDRIVVTFDKDFGESAFRRGLPSSSGFPNQLSPTADTHNLSAIFCVLFVLITIAHYVTSVLIHLFVAV